MWTASDWNNFCALLDGGWPGDFTPDQADAYRALLDDIEPVAAGRALKALLRSSRFRPSAGEIVQAIEADRRQPTFDEAMHVLFAHPRSPLKHRDQQAAVDAAMDFHPLIARFVQVKGRDALAYMRLEDPEYGGARRRELREAWLNLADVTAQRDVAALVAGAHGRAGRIGRLDPLRALRQIEGSDG